MRIMELTKKCMFIVLTVLFLAPAPKAEAGLILYGAYRDRLGSECVPSQYPWIGQCEPDLIEFLGLGLFIAAAQVSVILPILVVLDEGDHTRNITVENALSKKYPFLNRDPETKKTLAGLVAARSVDAVATLSLKNPRAEVQITRAEILDSVKMSDFSDSEIKELTDAFAVGN